MVDHLSREELLRYIDNELSKRGARKAAEHLCKCAGCAFELDRLKEDLAAITQAEIEIVERLLPAPPEPWPSLEWKLDAAATTSKNSRPRLFKPFTAIWKFPLAYGSAGLALLLCFLLIWGPLQPLSAKEVIERATAADTARLTITPQQVVRQRVRVTEKARLGSGEHTARMESWKSVRSAYWQTGSDSPNTNLHRHYEQNGLASDLPLSPPALGSWVKLAGSEPRASRNQGTIQIQVASNAEGRARGLDEFSFRVQARDWHVDEMTLSFEDAVFQIEEEDSSIFDRREVPADVLAKLEPQPKSAFPAVHAAKSPRNVRAAVNLPANLDDLEMSVRYDLHRMGADLGDSIEITRAPSQLVVNAWGISPRRKEQLVAVLANKPGIQLEFQPPVTSGRNRQNPTTAVPSSVNRQQDSRLVDFFGGADAEENYTRGVLHASTEMLAHLYALRELALRWPPGQDSNLSSAAKTQLSAILRDHANGVQASFSELEPQINLLLKGFGYEPVAESPAVGNANWQEASVSELDKARTTDRILRSLLTTSETPMSVDDALPKLKQSVQELASGVNQLRAVQ